MSIHDLIKAEGKSGRAWVTLSAVSSATLTIGEA